MGRGTSWTQDQEMLLAEIILRNIRQGYSIGRAYDEAESRLGRTRSGVAAYWNNNLAGAYHNAMEIAQFQGRKAREDRNLGKQVDSQHIEWIKNKYPDEDNERIMERLAAAEAQAQEEVEITEPKIELPDFNWVASEPQIKRTHSTIDQHNPMEIKSFSDVIQYLETAHKYIQNLEEENTLLNMYYEESTKENEQLKKDLKEAKEYMESMKELLDVAKKLQGISIK